jgi:hypothetical protein
LRRAVEPEQQDPLPLAEAEVAGGERDLLAARPERVSSRRISFVMSSTVSEGSAEAIEYGTSTLVIPAT